ncbi:MAG: hypothetical protein ABIW46_02095 [Acidimicrobiales bacterium]
MRARDLVGIVVSAALVVSTACGDSDSALDPSSTASSASTTEPPETKATTKPAERVGEITTVLSATALVNDVVVGGGDPITSNAVLATSGQGVVSFSLEDKLEDCQLSPGGNLRVQPSVNVLLTLGQGQLWCRTDTSEKERVFEVPGGRVTVRDPVFALDTRDGGGTVRVAYGFVEARSDNPDASGRLVGPNAAYTIPTGPGPARAKTFDPRRLESVERSAIDRMVAAVPRPNFDPPNTATSSGVLARTRRREALRAGFTNELTGASRTFAKAFLGFVADKWGVGFVWSEVAVGDMSDRLGTDFDVVVAPDGTAFAAGKIPYFGAPDERSWSLLVDPDDQEFAEALQDFLVDALNIGEYGDRYVTAFGVQPTYEAVRSLIFG